MDGACKVTIRLELALWFATTHDHLWDCLLNCLFPSHNSLGWVGWTSLSAFWVSWGVHAHDYQTPSKSRSFAACTFGRPLPLEHVARTIQTATRRQRTLCESERALVSAWDWILSQCPVNRRVPFVRRFSECFCCVASVFPSPCPGVSANVAFSLTNLATIVPQGGVLGRRGVRFGKWRSACAAKRALASRPTRSSVDVPTFESRGQ